MIVYKELPNGSFRLEVQCDVCHEPIRSHAGGRHVVMGEPGTWKTPRRGAKVRHVHKGVCLQRLEVGAEVEDAPLLDGGLAQHLKELAKALQVDLTELATVAEGAADASEPLRGTR
jgi:hypothetical protein